jgi:glycosyltransferase involved in cell wall biosynthesis
VNSVAIDLTPVLPGGENGGAKPLTLELVRSMAAQRRGVRFLLFTTARNHGELAALDAPNVERRRARAWFRYEMFRPRADLLFCPLTEPLYHRGGTPTISLIHDLQFLAYPEFFSAAERGERMRHFRAAVEKAALLICPSEFVRATILEHSGLPPGRVRAVRHRAHRRLADTSADERRSVAASQGLAVDSFLIYPANFWKHKNHERLLEAFRLFLDRHPGSPTRLVCTGAPGARRDQIEALVRASALEDRVMLAGYLDERTFAALFAGAKALVFPSLYEGFGMPVIEAMAMGKPVLCSNCTALPEVAGDAALLFDPLRPASIAGALGRLEDEPDLCSTLAERGRARSATFGDCAMMAEEYLSLFDEVLSAR